jgi:hypothetical protein
MDQPGENKKSSLSILASFKLIITEWFLSSTAHALPNIFRTGNIFLKIMWLCCFLASASWCIASMITTLNNYYTWPSYISTKIIQEIPTQFPAVSFCNMKAVNKTRSQYYLDTKVIKLNASVYVSPLFYSLSQQYLSRSAINNDLNLTLSEKKSIGFELKDMLVSCCFNYEPCYLSDFTYFYDSTYGNCYTFNKGYDENGTNKEIKTLSLAGPLYGLILELFLGDPNVDTYLEPDDGLLVSIHNQSSVPFTQGDRIKVAAGAETDLIVNRNFISKLEFPYGDCLKDTSSKTVFTSYYFDYLVKTMKVEYNQENCFALCLQKYIMESCNCSNSFMPAFNFTTHFCVNPRVEIPCMKNVITNFSKTSASLKCQEACPFECNSIEYGITSYRALFPSTFYASILYDALKNKRVNISYDNIGKAVSRVNIYYKSMQYLSTQQVISTSSEDLFSNIGGTLGLYIGISVLSLVEVFELGFNLMMVLISSIKSKKQITNNNFEIVETKVLKS